MGTTNNEAGPAAQAIDLGKTYGTGQAEVRALAGVDVTFERGRFTAVMGPSGSGKSTLMHCMAGLDRPTSGQSLIGGLDIGKLDDPGLTQLRRDHIGFVFQSFNLVPVLTAGENITLPVDLAGRKVDRGWFDYLVGQLGIGDRLDHRPNEMSGGQQQRVACRASVDKQARPCFRRRADRQPRLERLGRHAGVPAPIGGRPGPVHRHGHPRPTQCRLRRPGPFPGRWESRRRAQRTDGGPGAGQDAGTGGLKCARSPSRASSLISFAWP